MVVHKISNTEYQWNQNSFFRSKHGRKDAQQVPRYRVFFQQRGTQAARQTPHQCPEEAERSSSGSLALTTRSGPSTRGPADSARCRALSVSSSCRPSHPQLCRGGPGSPRRTLPPPAPGLQSQTWWLRKKQPEATQCFQPVHAANVTFSQKKNTTVFNWTNSANQDKKYNVVSAWKCLFWIF